MCARSSWGIRSDQEALAADQEFMNKSPAGLREGKETGGGGNDDQSPFTSTLINVTLMLKLNLLKHDSY